jgi:hypothetical protein
MSVTINASTSSGLVQTADTSGTVEIQSNGTTKFTVASTGAYGQITSGTAVASTSGTSIDFTSIPSWAKRITVMFQGVSLSGTDDFLVQLGTGATPTYTTSGYLSTSAAISNGATPATNNFTTGFNIYQGNAAYIASGQMVITLMGSNLWVSSHAVKRVTTGVATGGGDVTLGATLTAVRITTTGTNTFDAGSINIMYEG